MNKYIAAMAGTFILAGAMALPAFAAYGYGGLGVSVTATASATANTGATGTSAGTGANVSAAAGTSGGSGLKVTATTRLQTIITNATNRADQEITRRINALNALSTRVNAMVKLSADEKSSLSSTIQGQITLMNNLQTQIAADAQANSTSSLKADIQSITKSYRIFALIIPQGAIEAAADRVEAVVGLMNGLSAKLQARITADQNAGDNVSADASAIADMNTQTANAQALAQAAVTETASLQPDNGVASVMASNTAALKDARSKIMTAQQDLTAARKDAGTIVKDLLSLDASTSASATASGTVSATP